MTIAIFTTGGTIDKVYFDAKGAYHVGAPMVRELLEHARLQDLPEIVELLRKDSLEMTDEDRQLIRAAVADCEAPRVLVTHGTDTMVATARALQGIVRLIARPPRPPRRRRSCGALPRGPARSRSR